MKKKNTKQYFDGGNILSLLGGLSNAIPSDTTAGGAAGGAISGASSLSALGPYGMAAGALLGGIGGGIQGYKQNMNNQINPYTDGVDQRNKMLNIMADGGFLTSFDGGYTHNDPNPNNVNGGIPQGKAPDGRLNTVEKGEAKEENFVYSNSPDFIITKDMIKGTNLPDYVIGKTPAEAAKMVNDKLKDNPNNKIVKETTEIFLNQLKGINTNLISETAVNEFADGGYLSPSQYSQQMQLRDFDPSIPQMQPRIDQLPVPEQKLDTRLNRIPLDFLGTARKQWPIQDQNLLNTPNMPDRSKGISPQMVSAGQQARDYNANINDYLRDVGRILNKSYIEGDTRPENEIIRDIVGDYDKQPLTTKTFSNGGDIHIDPSKKGTFTTQATKMGMSVQEAAGHILANKDNYSPKMVKKAVFAHNFAHDLGGTIQHGTNPILQIKAKTGNIGDFYDPANPSLPFEGYKPANGSDWTRRGYVGNDFDTQNEWVKGQLSPENIKMWLDPSSELNKGVSWRQSYIDIIKQQQPKLYEDLLTGKVPIDKLQELYTEKEVGPIQSLVDFPQQPLGTGRNDQPLQKMTPRTPTVDFPKFGLAPMSPKQPTVEEPGTPPSNMNLPNLLPEFIAGAGLLSEGLNPILANPTIRSLGYVKAPKSDLMTQDKLLQEQYNTGAEGLTSASNGSLGGLKDNILALNYNIGLGRSNAYAAADARDAQMKLQTDMYNNEAQDRVGADNMQVLNNFDLENTELRNNYKLKKMDDRISNLKEYGQNRFNIAEAKRLENARRRDIEYFTGYKIPDSRKTIQLTPGTPGIPQHEVTWEEWMKAKNPNKFAENIIRSDGGMIKTIKRSLK